jgi:hypothetical protein
MKFIILSTPRAGTNLLRSYLDSHKEFRCDLELPFCCGAAMSYLAGEVEGIRGAKRNKQGIFELEYTEHFPQNYYNFLPENSGFVIHYHQIDPNIYLTNFNVVHLVRKNIFERAISVYIFENGLRGKGRFGNHFFKFNPYSIDFEQKFRVERRDLEHIMRESQDQVNFWKSKLECEGVNYLTVYYEDLFDERSLTKEWRLDEGPVAMPQATAHKIIDFLEGEYQDMYSYFKRVNTPDYHNYILNWEEIKDLAENKINI